MIHLQRKKSDIPLVLENILSSDPYGLIRSRLGMLDLIEIHELNEKEQASLIHDLMFSIDLHVKAVRAKKGTYVLRYQEETVLHLNWEKYNAFVLGSLEHAGCEMSPQKPRKLPSGKRSNSSSPVRRKEVSSFLSSFIGSPATFSFDKASTRPDDKSSEQIVYLRKCLDNRQLIFPNDSDCPFVTSPLTQNSPEILKLTQLFFTNLKRTIHLKIIRSGLGESISYDFRSNSNRTAYTAQSLRFMSFLLAVSRGDPSIFSPLGDQFINSKIKKSPLINPLMLSYATLNHSHFVASAAHVLLHSYMEALPEALVQTDIIKTGLIILKHAFSVFKMNPTRTIYAVFGPLENILFYYVFMFHNFHVKYFEQNDIAILQEILAFIIE